MVANYKLPERGMNYDEKKENTRIGQVLRLGTNKIRL
jgi:hypothetical protein